MPDERDPRKISAQRMVAAPPEEIFAVLTDPSKHPIIDGSGTVKRVLGKAGHLKLGSKFGMRMRIGIPYPIRLTVVEFEPDRLIAWCPFNGHRWRYRLEPVEGGTEVTETFDWSMARSKASVERMGFPKSKPKDMERTLERLDAYVTTGAVPAH